MVLNATFNLYCGGRFLFFVGGIGIPGGEEHHRPAAIRSLTLPHMLYRVQLTISGIRTHNFIGDNYYYYYNSSIALNLKQYYSKRFTVHKI